MSKGPKSEMNIYTRFCDNQPQMMEILSKCRKVRYEDLPVSSIEQGCKRLAIGVSIPEYPNGIRGEPEIVISGSGINKSTMKEIIEVALEGLTSTPQNNPKFFAENDFQIIKGVAPAFVKSEVKTGVKGGGAEEEALVGDDTGDDTTTEEANLSMTNSLDIDEHITKLKRKKAKRNKHEKNNQKT
jgi:hypothetical protein